MMSTGYQHKSVTWAVEPQLETQDAFNMSDLEYFIVFHSFVLGCIVLDILMVHGGRGLWSNASFNLWSFNSSRFTV